MGELLLVKAHPEAARILAHISNALKKKKNSSHDNTHEHIFSQVSADAKRSKVHIQEVLKCYVNTRRPVNFLPQINFHKNCIFIYVGDIPLRTLNSQVRHKSA